MSPPPPLLLLHGIALALLLFLLLQHPPRWIAPFPHATDTRWSNRLEHACYAGGVSAEITSRIQRYMDVPSLQKAKLLIYPVDWPNRVAPIV